MEDCIDCCGVYDVYDGIFTDCRPQQQFHDNFEFLFDLIWVVLGGSPEQHQHTAVPTILLNVPPPELHPWLR